MKVVVGVREAGGAAMIASWLSHEKPEWSAIAIGPSRGIFLEKFGQIPASIPWGEADVVVVGSGSAFELLFWQKARKKHGCRTAVYLDHWRNYRQRFVFNGDFSLPDEVWVTDGHAARIARRELPGANVIVKGNHYAEQVAKDVLSRPVKPHSTTHVLYVEEPGRGPVTAPLLRRIAPEGHLYRPRPHPSKEVSKRTLAEDLSWADVVVGWDTMAMAVALRAKRRVVSLVRDDDYDVPWTGIERPFRT